MLLPMLTVPMPLPLSMPLPATLLSEVMDVAGTRAYGSVDAPGWVMPVAAVGCGLIPVFLLALSKGAGPPVGAVEGASVAVQGARDRVYAIANRHPTLWRRLRRERFLSRWDLAVLDTEGKGKGLFAQHAIPAGAYLFDYEGETLDLPAYQSRYPDKVSDYAVGVKMPSGVMRFMDAADPRKSGLARFMNHDRRRANVRRQSSWPPRIALHRLAPTARPAPPARSYTTLHHPCTACAPTPPCTPPSRTSPRAPHPVHRTGCQVRRATKLDDPAGPRVLMYTSKKVEAGEELQWGYGAGYWAAREGLVEG